MPESLTARRGTASRTGLLLASLFRVARSFSCRSGVEDLGLNGEATLRGIEANFAVHRFPHVAKPLSNADGQTACFHTDFTGDRRPTVAVLIFDFDLNRFAHQSPF